MSNKKLNQDCCGDRYTCNTSKKCKCGCNLYYCESCYKDHMTKVAEKLIKILDIKLNNE